MILSTIFFSVCRCLANKPRRTFWPLIVLLEACCVSFAVAKAHGADLNDQKSGQKAIQQAIERGISFLRESQYANGCFGEPVTSKSTKVHPNFAIWPVGFTALPALALLEAGAAADDPAIKKAARFVRSHIPKLNRTYEISLAVLFLDRLRDPRDEEAIRSLVCRLLAGQNAGGGWSYTCPLLQIPQEAALLQSLRKDERDLTRVPVDAPKAKAVAPVIPERADHSNTQFALLALWVGRRYQLPVSTALKRSAVRFRNSQAPNGGWGYHLHGYGAEPYGSMTGAALLALAFGHACVEQKMVAARSEDKAMLAGLRALAEYLEDPSDTSRLTASPNIGPKGAPNLYFLWSVERVGVSCGIATIGGKDWYRWGVNVLLPLQRNDGSWIGRGNNGAPVIDTSMALLFLKRCDLLPDLREALHKRIVVSDPGPLGHSQKEGQASK